MEVTTDSGVDSDEHFDIDPNVKGESDFDDQVNSDANSEDENM